jgi:translation initiation factor 1
METDMTAKSGKVVFSTAAGDQRKIPNTSSSDPASGKAAPATLKIMRDNKGRHGKMVTVISGFTLPEAGLKTLSKTLKTLCGSGGTVKEGGIIEVQGDHREKVAEKLKTLGYKVKLAGG